jgi:hypothetical protein
MIATGAFPFALPTEAGYSGIRRFNTSSAAATDPAGAATDDLGRPTDLIARRSADSAHARITRTQ